MFKKPFPTKSKVSGQFHYDVPEHVKVLLYYVEKPEHKKIYLEKFVPRLIRARVIYQYELQLHMAVYKKLFNRSGSGFA